MYSVDLFKICAREDLCVGGGGGQGEGSRREFNYGVKIKVLTTAELASKAGLCKVKG